MAVIRVVGDSDEEVYEGSPSPARVISSHANDGLPSSAAPHLTLTDSGQTSTSSTESLKREIQDAQLRLMERTPIRRDASSIRRDGSPSSISNSPQYIVSLDGASRKRKRAASAVDRMRKRNIPRRHRLDDASCAMEGHGSSDSELLSCWESRRSQPDSRDFIPSNNTTYAADSLQQQRRLGNLPTANNLCRADLMASPTQLITTAHSTCSITDANLTESLSMAAQTQKTNALPSPAHLLPSVEPDRQGSGAVFSAQSLYTPVACTTSSLDAMSHNKGTRATEATAVATYDPAAKRKNPSEHQAVHRSNADEDEDELSHCSPDRRLLRSTKPIVILPDLCSKTTVRTNKTSLGAGKNDDDIVGLTEMKTRDMCDRDQSHEKQNIRAVESDNDDDIGFPQEHYKPKPSRSRSGRTNGDLLVPTDYSKRPEAIAKSTIPKTSSVQVGTDHPVHMLPSFSEPSDDKVLTLDHSRFIDAVNDHYVNQQLRKQDNANEIKESILKPESPSRKQIPLPSDAAPKKPRGRPRKVETTKEKRVATKGGAILDTQSVNLESSVLHEVALPLSQLVQEQHTNDMGQRGLGEDANPAVIFSETTVLHNISPTKQVETLSPPETPPKSFETGAKGPDRHSPISNGKMAYRVGLSKRARIAPLLRIVRS